MGVPRKLLTFLLCALCTGVVCACASPTSDSLSADVESVRELTGEGIWHWTSEVDCSLCHDEDAAAIICVRGMAVPGSCCACHTNVTALSENHLSYDKHVDEPSLTTTKEACLSCHSRDELIAATAGKPLVDAEGRGVNPHNLPANADHRGAFDCTTCHKMHTQSDAQTPTRPLCAGCHHEDVFQCYTCHA